MYRQIIFALHFYDVGLYDLFGYHGYNYCPGVCSIFDSTECFC